MIILDTNALITLLMKDKDQAEYKNLIAFLNQAQKFSMALPMPAISEFIAGDDNEARSLSLLKPESKFKKLNFDAKAALNAAKVYREYRNLPKNRKSQEPRQKVKVDIQIIGIALANDATTIISHDQGIKTVVNELGLALAVYDYVDNDFYNKMASLVVTQVSSVS